jgi:hypothetical protein
MARAEYGIIVGRDLDNRGALRVFNPARDIVVRRVKWLKVVLPPAQVKHLNIHSHERRHVLDDLEIDEELEALPIPETIAGSAWISHDDDDICEFSRQE